MPKLIALNSFPNAITIHCTKWTIPCLSQCNYLFQHNYRFFTKLSSNSHRTRTYIHTHTKRTHRVERYARCKIHKSIDMYGRHSYVYIIIICVHEEWTHSAHTIKFIENANWFISQRKYVIRYPLELFSWMDASFSGTRAPFKPSIFFKISISHLKSFDQSKFFLHKHRVM